MSKKRIFFICIGGAVVLVGFILWLILRPSPDATHSQQEQPQELFNLFGIEYADGDYIIEEGTISSGQSVSTIFSRYGVSPAIIDQTEKAANDVFSLRNIRAGQNYTAFLTPDSLSQLVHFVYEHNMTDYLVVSYVEDSIAVHLEHKDIVIKRQLHSGVINSSLWNSMIDSNIPPVMSIELEALYQWTIDFFGLREGDRFTVIYDEKFVDSLSVGVGQIWGAVFTHANKDYYAIPFNQGGKITYWDENANSLRKSMLKAPLKYSRISSRFSNSRLHPILKIRRPHHGVDYAAPSGTPVQSVANGTVIFKGWDSKGGGNTLKIRHVSGLVTGYLHLRGFAKGISVGTRVNQGDLIGYVGSTGSSTGPHLDYRIWKNGKAIDPLKLTAEPAEPISKGNMGDFNLIKTRTLAELSGELPDEYKITQLDSLEAYRLQIVPNNMPNTDSVVTATSNSGGGK